MALYYYKAINEDGEVVKGTVSGPDLGSAREYILSTGLYLLKIRKIGELAERLNGILASRRVKTRDIIEFAKSISFMLKSGVHVLQGIHDIADSADNPAFGRILEDVAREVEQGANFSEAFERRKDVFPDILIRLTAIGEETGRLDRSFMDAAAYLEKMEEIYSTIKKALMYPAFALLFTFGALVFWLIFVLPNVMKLFSSMTLDLPLPTRILLVMSNICREYWYMPLLAPLAVILAIAALKRNRGSKYYLDLATLKAPIVKHICYNGLLSFVCGQLRLLTSAGVTINRSLRIIEEVVGNEVFRVAVKGVREEIESGTGISTALRKHAVFPGLAVRLVQVGETSGTLETQFAYLAEYYTEKLNDFSEKMGKMLEPIIIAAVGAMFALIIIGLLLPVYDLVAKV